jgi:hypothetical protein
MPKSTRRYSRLVTQSPPADAGIAGAMVAKTVATASVAPSRFI